MSVTDHKRHIREVPTALVQTKEMELQVSDLVLLKNAQQVQIHRDSIKRVASTMAHLPTLSAWFNSTIILLVEALQVVVKTPSQDKLWANKIDRAPRSLVQPQAKIESGLNHRLMWKARGKATRTWGISFKEANKRLRMR